MTFKHITYGERVVMRSFEKVARERNIFGPDPIVKEASVESYESTNDLLSDMLHLAYGLKDKGFVTEANSLEDRIFEHKQAAKAVEKAVKDEGEKMLEDAHPEGDVEVAPSKGGYGKMLTQKTTQDEIKRIINKMPTGKYAQLGRPIAANQIGVKMAAAFGAAMAPYVSQSAGDIADVVTEHLVRILIIDLKNYPSSAMQKVSNIFMQELKTEAQGWGIKIQEDKAKTADYDMDEGLKLVAGDMFAAAVGKMQSTYGQEGTYSSVIENIVKAAEDALDIVKTAIDFPGENIQPVNEAREVMADWLIGALEQSGISVTHTLNVPVEVSWSGLQYAGTPQDDINYSLGFNLMDLMQLARHGDVANVLKRWDISVQKKLEDLYRILVLMDRIVLPSR